MLSRRTINAKAIGSISTLMNVAMDEELIESNPCERAGFKKVDGVERLSYSTADLPAGNALAARRRYRDVKPRRHDRSDAAARSFVLSDLPR